MENIEETQVSNTCERCDRPLRPPGQKYGDFAATVGPEWARAAQVQPVAFREERLWADGLGRYISICYNCLCQQNVQEPPIFNPGDRVEVYYRRLRWEGLEQVVTPCWIGAQVEIVTVEGDVKVRVDKEPGVLLFPIISVRPITTQ